MNILKCKIKTCEKRACVYGFSRRPGTPHPRFAFCKEHFEEFKERINRDGYALDDHAYWGYFAEFDN